MRVPILVLSAALMGIALAGSACAPGGVDAGDDEETGDEDPDPDESDALFDPDHIVEIDIELSAAAWDELRGQSRDADILEGEDCQAEAFANPFTYFPADVTVDGVSLEDVGVRKKGFLGSLDEIKPSLKLDFQEFQPGLTAHGVDRMTLNNSKQDPAFVRQCLAYQTFATAGLAAPRCNFAHVSVNGEDLGVFVNVEPVKKSFLRRHFVTDEGNLYEGTLSDFREGWLATFEKKTNKSAPGIDDLEDLTAAVQEDDAGALDRIAEHVDVDQFIDFWAMEVLIGHWDGYASNTNNFFVYRDPAQDRFVFLPWGVDGVMGTETGDPPHSVKAMGILAHRLYQHPQTRDQYRERLGALLTEVWDEKSLHDEVDRMHALIGPIADDTFSDDLPAAIDDAHEFIDTQRSRIQPELDASAPAWEPELRNNMCLVRTGALAVTFATSWGNLDPPDPFSVGTATVTGELFGTPLAVLEVGAQSGLQTNEAGIDEAQVRVLAWLETGDVAVIFLVLPPELFTPASYPLGFEEVVGGVILLDPNAPEGEFTYAGNVFGELTLDQATAEDGQPVVGSFTGEVLLFGG